MLATDDRQLLQELVRPPEGFTFSEGIVTTYSLDLLSLLMVPLHFTTIEYESGQGDGKPDPLALLSALQENVDRLSVYCQAGQIAVPSHQQRLFGYLEPAVIEVTAPRPRGVFHPKVWVLRYTDGDAICYRLGVFSRNLTADRCWDTALVLEGDLMDRKRGYGVNAPLAEFVEALPGMGIRTLGAGAADRAQRFAAELRKVDFDIPEPFTEFGFWPLGHQTRRTRPFKFGGRRGLLVSPFVSDSVLEDFADNCDEATLVSRADALDAISPSTLAKFHSIKVMADAVSTEAVEEGTTTRQSPLSGLHAKLFLMEQGQQGVIFVGSANATHAAMNQNVEFMVELVGGRSTCGVDALLSGESQNNFGALLQDYSPPADGPVPESTEQRLERLLSREAARLAGQLTGLRAEPVGEGTWSLTVAGTAAEAATDSPAISATCRPLTLSDFSAQPITWSDDGAAAQFREVSEEALTSFLVVSLKAGEGQVEVAKEFVLNLPLKGGPPHRRAGIVRSILRDRRSVMRFLMMLLSDVEAVLLGDLDVNRDGKGNGNGNALHARVLLEPMLRALHREPERLDRIDRLMVELSSPEDAERLPVGWNEIWGPIWAERQRVRA